jgi:hypothetical protein
VIDRVHYLARREKQHEMKDGIPLFEWDPGVPIDEDDVGPVIEYGEIEEPHENVVDYESDLQPCEDTFIIDNMPTSVVHDVAYKDSSDEESVSESNEDNNDLESSKC